MTLHQIETVDSETGEIGTARGYSAPVRVTVAGALPRTDLGVHPVVEDNFDGHDTAMKAAVTDGMKRAFRSFGVQFGNSFYGDQPSASAPQPERVAPPSQAKGSNRQRARPAQSAAVRARPRPSPRAATRRRPSPATTPRSRSCASVSSRSPRSRASTRSGVRSAVVERMGKSIDDLTAAELGSAGRGRRQQAAEDSAGAGRAGRLVLPVKRTYGIKAGWSPSRGLPRFRSTGQERKVEAT